MIFFATLYTLAVSSGKVTISAMQAAVPAVRSCNPAAGVDFTAYQKFLYELIKGIYKGDKMSL